jgi:hypothetical protein
MCSLGRVRRTVYILTGLSPNTGGRVREITVGEKFELESLKLFDPVAQEKTGFHPATIHKQHEQKSPSKITQTTTLYGNQSNSREPRSGLNLHDTETRYS